MDNRTIKGPLESINEQLRELRKDFQVKIGETTQKIEQVGTGKRISLTVTLELTKK